MIVKFSKWLQVVQANGESVLNRRGKKIIFLIFNFENFKQFKVDFSLVERMSSYAQFRFQTGNLNLEETNNFAFGRIRWSLH